MENKINNKQQNKKIVFALFDGLNGSVRKAIKESNHLNNQYEVIGFDIREFTKDGTKNEVLDMGAVKFSPVDILTLSNKLKQKYGRPWAIVASPMCMSFSRASAMKNGSTGWVFQDLEKKEGIKFRPKEDFTNPEINWGEAKQHWRYKMEPSLENARIGENALLNTISLIRALAPNYWYIENPAGSLMWNYTKYNLGFKEGEGCYYNLVHYGAYDAPSKKPTIFFSNLEIPLKKVEPGYKSKIRWENIKREDRSDIPLSLIKEIFWNFELDEIKF